MMDEYTHLITFLDKVAARSGLTRHDRMKGALADLKDLYPTLPDLLRMDSLGELAHPCDDGRRWGRIDASTGIWAELDKTEILKTAMQSPPLYWSAPDGRFVHVVHDPSET